MSTPERVQVDAQVYTLDFQRFTLAPAVKFMTFAANWQNLDGDGSPPNLLIGGTTLIL